ncbi:MULTISPECIES: transposase [Acetobacteraceae]|uniref:IS4/IS5 family transposase n=1 Tax=Novacetimonas pomaceti TaxID=2021998 RepID=A0A318Q5F7_9PROT|nr:hypothetical protein S101446_03444 [Komagataeibacter europaeus]PYD46563.1 IS4/IS5 family transposase [Novacetimonas pomaceti]PYD57842.1 IS4/IS5 family transposase [Novacetimonas maltaceti]PYD74747.1 IS4/IS5 family transposase [Novacetimonas pomaceti]SAY46941.1 Transposase DDE domain protein [Komagataeibacter rhaeticus]
MRLLRKPQSFLIRRYSCSTFHLRVRKATISSRQAIGRSWGGLTTKIHAICDALSNPVEIDITSGKNADTNRAEPMLENMDPDAFLVDRAHDADRLIDRSTERGITPVIPPKRNRTMQRATASLQSLSFLTDDTP